MLSRSLNATSRLKKRERTQNWSFEEKRYLLELCKRDMNIIENKRLDADLTALKNRWEINLYVIFTYCNFYFSNCATEWQKSSPLAKFDWIRKIDGQWRDPYSVLCANMRELKFGHFVAICLHLNLGPFFNEYDYSFGICKSGYRVNLFRIK